jgi:hypothetical protein
VHDWVIVENHPKSGMLILCRQGVWWNEAPLPHRVHRCEAQTKGWTSGSTYVERCACGAIKSEGRWTDKNWRRKGRRRNVASLG